MASKQRMEYPIMKLHEDLETFSELVGFTAEKKGLPEIYIEKDYWVTKALKHLSEADISSKVVFKGGTSLSKAYKIIERFSEDIDLAIFAESLNGNEKKRLLKHVEESTSNGLKRIENDHRTSKGSNYRKTVYRYPKEISQRDFGQASPELLIEINAFTNPEPFETKSIESLIAESLHNEPQSGLVIEFGLESFSLQVLSIHRTLVEKILGCVRDSYGENPTQQISNRIRHLYDICQILKLSQARKFVGSSEFIPMCNTCIQDDIMGGFKNAEWMKKPLSEAPIFKQFEDWKPTLDSTYSGVFADLVYGDLPSMEEIEEALQFIRGKL